MDDEVKDPLVAMDEEDGDDGEDGDKLAPGMHIEGSDDEDDVEADVDGTLPTDIDDPLMFDPLVEDKKVKKEKKDDVEDEEEEFPEDEEDPDVDLEDEEFADAEQW
ncbi:MAG: hypothetical protein ACYCZW_03605 [Minisyncoccota bacterium]